MLFIRNPGGIFFLSVRIPWCTLRKKGIRASALLADSRDFYEHLRASRDDNFAGTIGLPGIDFYRDGHFAGIAANLVWRQG